MTVGSRVKQTLADLQGIESTLRIYSLQSKNKDEIKAYSEAFKTTETVTKNIKDRLKTIQIEEPQYKGK
ncbi:DUF1657 domain-containing protein [Clostridium tyrobutyricum]|jgi:hypothetical protein|uniref:Uncharacterized protein n=1 Tax=Clostridium tyrobutyricum DIVETGP TaxID=1408889 RepID=W6NB39_CLOTY|nr:DUF1657 domain-containing protein [Clostridium tyrobutyricum]AND84665.1 hypothetical protein CTK_C14040 [Clostridium tyrobutyricum]ANP69264.1 hypothetical protein BA182_06130 [Clostridium tyrobutyricum]MBR9648413.1 DUF1657 domain-containing protein [Clostridium tyrobutyricum]MBV4421276.1 DUF1657 domain-containing protein [Clostridium tyrobutyricum]MBV4426338.1 DUF1657 domain-containing protein [Clostridium tyrobutyricum]